MPCPTCTLCEEESHPARQELTQLFLVPLHQLGLGFLSSLFGQRRAPLPRIWLRNPAAPGSRGAEASSFKDKMDAKKFSPPGPRPTDFFYSARTAEIWRPKEQTPKTHAPTDLSTLGGRRPSKRSARWSSRRVDRSVISKCSLPQFSQPKYSLL